MRLFLLSVFLLVSFPCSALYECRENGRVILSSAPCDTTWVPLARYGIGGAAYNSPSSMTLYLDRSNSYTVSGSVQGRSALFLVDTGASATAISGRLAVAAGLSRCVDAGVAHTANGAVRVCSAVVSEITFGLFRMTDVAVTILPNMSTDALLGMDILRQLKIEQRADQLTISR